MPFIHRTECERLLIIFNSILPGMVAECGGESDVPNIRSIVRMHLPKLEAKSLELALKCIKDDGCPAECMVCSQEYIETTMCNALRNPHA